MATIKRFIICAAALFAGAVQAAPPDQRVALELSQAKIEKVASDFTLVESDDPAIVHAELLPSGELLLEAKGKGVAHVFLFTDRLVRAIEVAVGTPLPETDPKPAGACAKPPITAACYPAWRAYLQHLDAKDAPPLELEIEGLQEELKAAQAILSKAGLSQIVIASSPFGLKLKGVADAAEERRALMLIWPALLGPLRIDR